VVATEKHHTHRRLFDPLLYTVELYIYRNSYSKQIMLLNLLPERVMGIPEMPQCFDESFSADAAAYSDGYWEPAGSPHPYRIGPRFWASIGSKMHADLPQHYGHCDDPVVRGTSPERKLYTWTPRRCHLWPFERKHVCKVLRGRQIVVVGDSTVFQTFLSLVLLLGGSFGRDLKHGYVVADLTASACDATTRLVFIRSDLLLWTQSVSDYHSVQRCDGFTILHPFIQRASRDADILLLGVGHHFPRSLMLAEKWTKWLGSEAARRARISFFARNLNHTLSSLLTQRTIWGHTSPASVVLLGASTPVRGCASFRNPLASVGDAVAAVAASAGNSGEPTTNEQRWMQYP
jgi:hypothetical protein